MRRTLYRLVRGSDTVFTWLTIICIWAVALFLLVTRAFGTEPYVVVSGSMEPMIEVGSLVFVEEPGEEIRTGDVIAFHADDGAAVIHRITGYDMEADGYLTKGDANDTLDAGVVSEDEIIGVYRKHIPGLGYLIANLDAHVFQIGAFKIPAAILIILSIKLILSGLRMALKENEQDKAGYYG